MRSADSESQWRVQDGQPAECINSYMRATALNSFASVIIRCSSSSPRELTSPLLGFGEEKGREGRLSRGKAG